MSSGLWVESCELRVVSGESSCELRRASCELRVFQNLHLTLRKQLLIMYDKEGLGFAAGMKAAATMPMQLCRSCWGLSGKRTLWDWGWTRKCPSSCAPTPKSRTAI